MDYVFEIVGIAKHSETEDILVVYKPLFDAESTWLGVCNFAARPLSMWGDIVQRNGEDVQRFTLIS